MQTAFHAAFLLAVDDCVQTQQLDDRALDDSSLNLALVIAHEHAARARLKLHAMHHARAEQLLPRLLGLIHAARKGRHVQPHAAGDAGSHLENPFERGQLHQIVLRLFRRGQSQHAQHRRRS